MSDVLYVGEITTNKPLELSDYCANSFKDFNISSPIQRRYTYENTYGSKIWEWDDVSFDYDNEPNVVTRALNTVSKHKNNELKKRAERILVYIKEIVDLFCKYKIDVNILPEIEAFFIEDDSILLEWIYNDYRIGFSIEINPDESGWYLITNSEHGEITSSGLIKKNNIPKIITWLIIFILLNNS